MNDLKEKIEKEFREIFGEKHHLVREGNKCECRKVSWQFISDIIDERDKIINIRETEIDFLEDVIEELGTEKSDCLNRCKELNGLPYCKNCGLSDKELIDGTL